MYSPSIFFSVSGVPFNYRIAYTKKTAEICCVSERTVRKIVTLRAQDPTFSSVRRKGLEVAFVDL